MAHPSTLRRRAQRSARAFNAEIDHGLECLEAGSCIEAEEALERASQLLAATKGHYDVAGRSTDTKVWREWWQRYADLKAGVTRQCQFRRVLND